MTGSDSHIGVPGRPGDPDGERVVALADLLRQFGAELAIRLHAADFALLPAGPAELTHFNLPHAANFVGARCVLLPIIRPGQRRGGAEVLPLVDPARFRMATCLDVVPLLDFDAVSRAQFATSLPTIRTAAELRAVLVARYKALVPGGEAAILAGGCSVTRLRLAPVEDTN